MIDISETAQKHFRHLLDLQQSDDLSIRMHVLEAGTPAANCELEFCERDELVGDEWKVDCEGFDFYVDGPSARWLEGATIDFEPTKTGGLLNIQAPKIKGEVPSAEAGLAKRVQFVIDSEINPKLAAHSGNVKLLDIEPGGVIVLLFGGGCHGCGMVDVTLKQGVEKTLREMIPEIKDVRDATDHTDGKTPYYKKHEGKSAMA